ncbi:hypothetical protein GE061_007061, partial [Apolygus lucorum]
MTTPKSGEEKQEEYEARLEQRLLGSAKLQGVIPKKRSEIVKWNGWGYNDSKFIVKPGPMVAFTGNRYPIGEMDLPGFTQWVIHTFDIDISRTNPSVPLPPPEAYPKPNIPEEFVEEVEKTGMSFSLEGEDRLMRCHGQTLHDIYTLRFDLEKSIPRIPDIVVWPGKLFSRVTNQLVSFKDCMSSQIKMSDFDITIELSDDDDDLETEETIRVIWVHTMKMHHPSVYVNQPLEKVFEEMSKMYNIPREFVDIRYNDEPVSPSDSLESLGFRVALDTLYASKALQAAPSASESISEPGKNKLHVKCLVKDRNRPLNYYLNPRQNLIALFEALAKELEVPSSQLKVKFDGDLVSAKDTPQSLDLDGGECFDTIPFVQKTHDHVVKLVELADKLGLVIIPYGGGTSVSGAVTCPDNELRPIVSLDTTQMNQIFWLDRKNLLICCQCGLVGQDLERYLQSRGFTVGHEPDSYEFSTSLIFGTSGAAEVDMKIENFYSIILNQAFGAILALVSVILKLFQNSSDEMPRFFK